MAYKQPFIKLTFGGSLAAGQEEWNCGVNLKIESAAMVPIIENPEAAFQAYIDSMEEDMADIVTSYVSSSDMDIPRGATLEYVKVALIGTDGLYVLDPYIWEIFDATGGVPSAYVPQVSTVITLSSRKRKDPGKYNRFYLPTVAPTGSTSYKIAKTALKATRSASFIASLNRRVATTFTSYDIEVAAVTQSDTPGSNYLPIEQIRVGDVFDTQRRRRNKLVEQYEIVTVPQPVPVTPLPDI